MYYLCIVFLQLGLFLPSFADTNYDFISHLDNPGVTFHNYFQFAYNYKWRGITITGNRPNVQGAFTISGRSEDDDLGFSFRSYFKMMISNIKKGRSAAYEEKIFHLDVKNRDFTAAVERVLYFTLGDSIIYPTNVENIYSLTYTRKILESMAVKAKVSSIKGQNSERNPDREYDFDLQWKWFILKNKWGKYYATGKYGLTSFGINIKPYTFGIKYSTLIANPDTIYTDNKKGYLFISYKTLVSPNLSKLISKNSS